MDNMNRYDGYPLTSHYIILILLPLSTLCDIFWTHLHWPGHTRYRASCARQVFEAVVVAESATMYFATVYTMKVLATDVVKFVVACIMKDADVGVVNRCPVKSPPRKTRKNNNKRKRVN